LSDSDAASILVVDDDEMNRDMLSRRLERKGFTVTLARDGAEALDLIGGRSFDLVVLDVMMPGIDGLQALETLRRSHSAADLPIIMATAKDGSDDVVHALKLGANDYVTKPLDFPVVLARIQTQLSLKRARRELEAAHARMRQELEAAARVQQALISRPPTRRSAGRPSGGPTFPARSWPGTSSTFSELTTAARDSTSWTSAATASPRPCSR